ncbi:MAG TPA: WD40 repeat domain-containing protein [Gemmataceae bacterium]|jgi:WD40 repeat protein
MVGSNEYLTATAVFLLGLSQLLGASAEGGEEKQIAILPRGAVHRLGLARLPTRSPAGGVAFSPDGKHLAASTGEASLYLWELPRGIPRSSVSNSNHAICCVAFSRDGLVVAAGNRDATVELREVKTGLLDRELHGHAGTVTAVAFSPDRRTLASAGEDRTVIVWDLRGLLLRRLDGHRKEVMTLAYSADGKTLATGGLDGTICLWDPTSGEIRRRLTTGSSGVFALVFTPDGKSIVAEGGDCVLRQWDAATGRELRPFRGHTDRVLAVAISRDGKTLASSGADSTIRLWSIADGTEKRRILLRNSRAAALAFSPDDKTLASGDRDCIVDLWKLDSEETPRLLGHRSAIQSITVSADGREVHTRSARETLHWDLKIGKLLKEITEKPRRPTLSRVEARSPDGKIVADEGEQAGVILCKEVATGRPICKLSAHVAPITCLVFSADGHTLISGSEDTSAVVWDLLACFGPDDTEWRPKQEDLEKIWGLLGDERRTDRAFELLSVLAHNAEMVVPFVKQKVPPPRNDRRVKELLADLDSDTFMVREKASRELGKLGIAAEPLLRRALAEKPTLELRRRIKLLLAEIRDDPETTRRWNRLVMLLEWDGSTKAREVLEALAGSSVRATVAQDARAALARLDKRAKQW